MLTEAQVFYLAVFTQALLYGIYLATLIQCFRWLIFTDEGWKLRQRINLVMTFATIFIFLMTTINLSTGLKYEIDQGIEKDENWYTYVGVVMTMDISWLLAVISIDGILVYRCWVVYEKSWHVICMPFIFWLASLACSALFSYTSALNYMSQTENTELEKVGKKALISLYACNIAITVYTTTAIIYRILSANKINGNSPRRLNYVMRILAESGIIYTSAIIFRLVGLLLIAGEDFTWVELVLASVSDSIGFSMAGITFNLILIRVYKSRVEVHDSMADSRNIYGEKTYSETQFEEPSSTALDGMKDAIEEHLRR